MTLAKMRKILFGLLFLALLANLFWYYVYPQRNETVDVLFEPIEVGLPIEDAIADRMPAYNKANGIWMHGGKQIKSLAPFLTDIDPPQLNGENRNGPDRLGKFMLIRIPEDALPFADINMLSTLVSEGICQVGFIHGGKRSNIEDSFEADIFRIIEINNDLGRSEVCHDRFNPDLLIWNN